ncbi:radical SAM protein [Candidatus Shapirobacteria bacterium]|nr:radical SAM protein [Candidatus Shapirobacteria bacterium]
MKIAIGYPPLESEKGIPLLGQNRQFQWAKTPWRAYPVVPAYGATLLKNAGYEVVWLDGISEEKTYRQWEEELWQEKPDILMMETKTPVVKKHWRIINKLKTQNSKLKTILVGDHVTALPEESFQNSRVDYILTGGDYDFLLLNLVNHLIKRECLEPGIWYRQSSKLKAQNANLHLKTQNFSSLNTGDFKLNHDLNSLPMIDRKLTRWELYAEKNSNYSRTPGTYTMFGRDCWWGKCAFCSWTTLYPGCSFRAMSPKRALDEIGYVIEKFGVREIMDDSGTFPVGEWLREFCEGMIKRGYNQKIKLDCNMRFNAGLSQKDYDLMGKAGFRFLLYGLESASQKTLDRINKNLKVGQIGETAKMAKKAGLWVHATAMVGYPWESKQDAQNTLNMTKDFFKRGLIDSLQATIVIPYPGTPLFRECQENNWLKTFDWDRYDMKEPVMKTEMADKEIMEMVRGIYSAFWSPEFVIKRLKEGLTNGEKFKYYAFMALKFASRKLDFRAQNKWGTG